MSVSWRGAQPQPPSLVDVLDKVLDKGLVVAGDIHVSLANVDLLAIRIRLLVCSIEKAEEIGLNWWKGDPFLTAEAASREETAALAARLDEIERRLPPTAGEQSTRPAGS